MIKRTLMLLLAGLGVGVGLSMWVGPGMLSWLDRPLFTVSVNCNQPIYEALRTLVQLQLIFGAVFGVVFAVAGNYLAARRAKAAAATPVPAPQPLPEAKP